jgi:hypothetical protein
MMLLFLDMRERGRLAEDDFGGEFATLEDARSEALASARQMMAERIRFGRPVNDVAFEIRCREGQLLLTVPWDDALVRN